MKKKPCCTPTARLFDHRRHWFGVTVQTDGADITHLLRDGMKQCQRRDRIEIGRVRHFKSPDKWAGDNGYMGVILEGKLGLHLGSLPCVFPKVDRSKAKKKRKETNLMKKR